METQLLPIALNHHEQSKRLLYAPSKIAAHSDGTTWQCLVYIEGLPCKTPGSESHKSGHRGAG